MNTHKYIQEMLAHEGYSLIGYSTSRSKIKLFISTKDGFKFNYNLLCPVRDNSLAPAPADVVWRLRQLQEALSLPYHVYNDRNRFLTSFDYRGDADLYRQSFSTFVLVVLPKPT